VETLFPVSDNRLKSWLIKSVLMPHLKDNVKTRILAPTGTYERLFPAEGEPTFNVQKWLLETAEEYDTSVSTQHETPTKVGD
jgi:polyphosphate kinase